MYKKYFLTFIAIIEIQYTHKGIQLMKIFMCTKLPGEFKFCYSGFNILYIGTGITKDKCKRLKKVTKII